MVKHLAHSPSSGRMAVLGFLNSWPFRKLCHCFHHWSTILSAWQQKGSRLAAWDWLLSKLSIRVGDFFFLHWCLVVPLRLELSGYFDSLMHLRQSHGTTQICMLHKVIRSESWPLRILRKGSYVVHRCAKCHTHTHFFFPFFCAARILPLCFWSPKLLVYFRSQTSKGCWLPGFFCTNLTHSHN